MLYYKIQDKSPPIFEAVGCICYCKGRILLLERQDDKSFPGHWGIPSGKLIPNETNLHAIIRELYEETTILLSSHNVNLIKTYHIINNEMSFLYTLYFCEFVTIPDVEIRLEEHKQFGFFKLEDALRMKLVPDLDNCLKDALPFFESKPVQLELFPSNKIFPSIYSLENSVNNKHSISMETLYSIRSEKYWHTTIGPPGAGKTETLKEMSRKYRGWKYFPDNTILDKKSRLNFYLRRAWIEGDYSFFFHFQMEVLHLRFQQIFHAPNYSLVDETIFSTLAYSRALYRLGMIKDYEYQTFFNLYLTLESLIPIPNKIYYFDCDIDTLRARIHGRKGREYQRREHEHRYKYNYLESLRFSFYELSKELSINYDVIFIDSSKNSIKEIVDQYGPQN